jgi:hypothetical protein
VAVLQQIAKRRAALASAHLEAGQGFWLAKQRWLWRRGRLSREQFLMLQLAGLEMDIDPPMQWKRLAHEAAHYLNGSQINPDQASHVSLCMAEASDIMISLRTGCTVACDLMSSSLQALLTQPGCMLGCVHDNSFTCNSSLTS